MVKLPAQGGLQHRRQNRWAQCQALAPLPRLRAFFSLGLGSLFLSFRVFFHECCHVISPFFLICAIHLSFSEKPVLQTLHQGPLFFCHLSIPFSHLAYARFLGQVQS